MAIDNPFTRDSVNAAVSSPGNNTAAGTFALLVNVDGKNNTAFGFGALQESVGEAAEGGNTGVGFLAGSGLTTGQQNVAIGMEALRNATTPASNVSVGFRSLANAAVKGANVAVGHKAGEACEGEGSVFIGYEAGVAEKGSNKLYVANTKRALILGDFQTNALGFFGAAPATKPEVTGATVSAKQLAEVLATLGLVKVN